MKNYYSSNKLFIEIEILLKKIHFISTSVFLLSFLIIFITRSTFAQQWQLAPETAGDPIAAISIYKSDPDTVYALAAGHNLGPPLFRSTDGGRSWDTISVSVTTVPFGTNIGSIKVDPFDSKLLYASTWGDDFESNNVDMSTDGGSTWKRLFVGRVSPAPVIEIDPVDNRTVYVGVGPSFIYRTTDQGVTWDTIGTQPPPAHFLSPLTSLAIAPSNDSVLYAGYTVGIYKSTDKGNTWQTLDLGLSIQSQILLAVDPKSADTVYAGIFSPASGTYSGGVYKSTDGGQTWNESDSGLTDQDKQINSLVINPKNPKQLFIGLYNYGVAGRVCFESTDRGCHWTDFSIGLGDSGIVICMAIDTANDKIFAGLSGYYQENLQGLYVTDITTAVKQPQVPNIPEVFQLLQNYPNPFNPSTIIGYEVPKYSHVLIIVYDVLGREIENLVDEWKQPGDYHIRFDGSRLSSGVYFYQLITEDCTETKKMILLR